MYMWGPSLLIAESSAMVEGGKTTCPCGPAPYGPRPHGQGPYGPGPDAPPGFLWAGPFRASLGPYGPGPCGSTLALMGRALMGHPGPSSTTPSWRIHTPTPNFKVGCLPQIPCTSKIRITFSGPPPGCHVNIEIWCAGAAALKMSHLTEVGALGQGRAG